MGDATFSLGDETRRMRREERRIQSILEREKRGKEEDF